MVDRLRVKLEVREPSLVLLQESIHTGMAVPDLTGGDDFVARMCESSYAAIEVVRVLGLHVLADRGFAPLADLGAVEHRVSMPRKRRPSRRAGR